MPSPLLPRIDPSSMPAALRDAWTRSRELRGDATLFEVFGNHPELFSWYVNRFYGELFHGGLVERPVKELLRLRLSTRHGCKFCNQGNRADALEAGLSPAQLDALAEGRIDAFSAREQAVVRLADRLSLADGGHHLDAALYGALREHFNDAEILELGMLAGLLSGMARFMFAFDLVEREPGCPLHPPAQETKEEHPDERLHDRDRDRP
jgi:AhpD family alkylhydroperoxidase